MAKNEQEKQVSAAEVVEEVTAPAVEVKGDTVAVVNPTQYDSEGAALMSVAKDQVNLESAFTDVSNVFFSSIVDDGNPLTKIKIYNAMNFTEGAFKSVNKPIVISDIIAHNITLMDEQTGEMIDAVRVVLVTPEGKGYHAVATGIMTSVQKIVGMFGRAPWQPALVVMPRRVPTRRGFETLTIDVIDVKYIEKPNVIDAEA
ncbi:hypothetical protein D3C81_375410 [compost metagenome]